MEVDVQAALKLVAPGLIIVTLPVTGSCSRLGSGEPMAKALEPIAAILEAFQEHQVVALGEGLHGNEQGHAFRLALLRDRRFPTVVNDIVVEFGNARYQQEPSPETLRPLPADDVPQIGYCHDGSLNHKRLPRLELTAAVEANSRWVRSKASLAHSPKHMR